MAHVTLNVAFRTLSGRVGDAVFYTRHGRQYMRAYVKSANPDTPAQRTRRSAFREAVLSWQVLPEDERQQWKVRARKLHMSGYNAFISHYMQHAALMHSDIYPAPSFDIARKHEDLTHGIVQPIPPSIPLYVRTVPAPYPRIARNNAPYRPALARHTIRL